MIRSVTIKLEGIKSLLGNNRENYINKSFIICFSPNIIKVMNKLDIMGGTISTQRWKEKCLQNFVTKYRWNRPLTETVKVKR
jgi:hypothetical protein